MSLPSLDPMSYVQKFLIGGLLVVVIGLAIFGGYEAYTKAVMKTDLVSCTDKNSQLTSTNEDWKTQTGVADAATAKLQMDGLKRAAAADDDQKKAALLAAPINAAARSLSQFVITNDPPEDISECAGIQQLVDEFYGVKK